MTPVQLRMSRAALEMSIETLAQKVAVGADEIAALEQGSGSPDLDAKVRVYFEGAGLSYKDETGVSFDDTKAMAGTVPLDQLNSANDE